MTAKFSEQPAHWTYSIQANGRALASYPGDVNIQGSLGYSVNILQFNTTATPVDPTGNVDSTAGIQNAINYASANGYSLYVPSGTYLVKNLTLMSNVDYYGDGVMSELKLIENSTNNAHIFYNTGVQRETYYARNWKAANDIPAGNAVTPTNPADCQFFPVGSFMLVCSTGFATSGGTDEQPFVGTIAKVVGNNGTTLTLQKPILKTIVGARIALQNDFTVPALVGSDNWVCHGTFRNIAMNLSSAPTGIQAQGFFCNGWYDFHAFDYYLIKPWAGFSNNAVCYSTNRNFIVKGLAPSAANIIRFIEIKTGSYCAIVKDVIFDVDATVNVASVPLFDIGEYAQYVLTSGMVVRAPNVICTNPYTVGPSASIGENIEFEDFDVILGGCNAFCSNNQPFSSSYPNYSGLSFKRMHIDSPACAQTLRLLPNTVGTAQMTVDGIDAKQPNAAPGGSSAVVASIITTDFNGFVDTVVNNLRSDGPWFSNPSGPMSYSADFTFCNSMISGVVNNKPNLTSIDLQPFQVSTFNIRRFREGLLKAAQFVQTSYGVLVTATGNTVLGSANFPNFASAFGWSQWDSILIDFEAYLSGTLGAKTVQLIDVGNGNTVIASINSAVSNTVRIKARLTYYGVPGQYSGMTEVTVGGSSPVLTQVLVVNTTPNFNFQLVGNIAVTGDYIRYDRCSIVPKIANGYAEY